MFKNLSVLQKIVLVAAAAAIIAFFFLPYIVPTSRHIEALNTAHTNEKPVTSSDLSESWFQYTRSCFSESTAYVARMNNESPTIYIIKGILRIPIVLLPVLVLFFALKNKSVPVIICSLLMGFFGFMSMFSSNQDYVWGIAYYIHLLASVVCLFCGIRMHMEKKKSGSAAGNATASGSEQ